MAKNLNIEIISKNITDKEGAGIVLSFPGFLEESDITYEVINTELPFWTLNFKNNNISNRILQKIKIVFNVFSFSDNECQANFEYLQQLINILKPVYFKQNTQYRYADYNINGSIKIRLAGLPIDPEFDIFIENFSYEINNEMGFLNKNKKLFPISYKIFLEGKIIQKLDDTIALEKNDPKWETVDGVAEEKSAEEDQKAIAEKEKQLNDILLKALNIIFNVQYTIDQFSQPTVVWVRSFIVNSIPFSKENITVLVKNYYPNFNVNNNEFTRIKNSLQELGLSVTDA